MFGPIAKAYSGPTTACALGVSYALNRVPAEMKGIKRIFCTIPAHIAAVPLLALVPVAMLVDRIVKPILKAANLEFSFSERGPKMGKKKFSVKGKIFAFVSIVPKLILTAPLAALTLAVGAAALPILFTVAVVKSFMGKPLFSK